MSAGTTRPLGPRPERTRSRGSVGRTRVLAVVLVALATVALVIVVPGSQSSATGIPAVTPTPAPTVTGIRAPSSGPVVGGAIVTITGTNFVGYNASDDRYLASAVLFGSTPSTDFEVDTATSITAAAPAATATGTVDVTVVTDDGTSSTSSADQYTYVGNWNQGTVSSLPATSSSVSGLTGNGPLFAPATATTPAGPYASLQVSVNQTKNLTDQAISVSWTGAPPTLSDSSGDFLGDYLQMFECWSDPSASGPSPSQCDVGGESSSTSNYPIDQADAGSSHEFSRVLAQPGWSSDTPAPSCATSTGTAPCTDLSGTSPTDFLIQPFQAADGTIVRQQANYNYDQNPLAPVDFWLNPYFSFDTTNEVDFARTLSPEPGQTLGSGQQLFDVDTGLNAPGLGCGQTIQAASGSGSVTPQCWLVVVPRGKLDQENPAGLTGVNSVVTSPLTPQAWANRITIPLEFNPVGSSCSINANSQQIEGSELATPAVSSWEPALCDLPGSQPFSYLQNDDDEARQNITDPSYGSVGMSVFSDPIPSSQTSASNPVVYAPLTLSGAVIAFNIQRVPTVEPDGTLDTTEANDADSRVQNLYLTPRLVAKLLTESYQAELKGVARTTVDGYAWVQNNPISIFDDPDFLQYNPEFELMTTAEQIDAATMLVEEGSSDAAATLWKWVLADPSARAWLNGTPDPWGMVVNPYYEHLVTETPAPESYPKSDPWCDQATPKLDSPPNPAPPNPAAYARKICVQDWSPYVLSMAAAALGAANANDGGKTTFNPVNSQDTAWTSNGPQITGNDLIISVTDSASAARYGLQTASLSPAGDDTDPTFVAPDSASLLAGEQAMVASPVPGVVEPDPSSTGTGAYPLTMLTYAAATPESLNPSSRQNYASFLRYAAVQGQVPGVQPGDLPAGYEPLPASLVAETLTAADAILHPPSGSSPASPSASRGTATSSPSSSTTAGSSPSSSSLTTAASARSTKIERQDRRKLGPVTLSAVRVDGLPVGVLRWVLPIVLLIGLLAALGALVMRLTGGKPAPAGASTDPVADEPGPDPS